MPEVTAVPIGSDRVTTADEIVVTSPYDGSEVGRVPACDAGHVDRAVAAATAALAEPLPAHARAAVLDRAAVLLAERQEDFARTIAAEAAKPLKTARVEAARAVDTFRFSAAEARTLAGDMVPPTPPRRATASSGSPCGCRSGSSGPSARSTSRSTWWPTRWHRPSPPAAPSC